MAGQEQALRLQYGPEEEGRERGNIITMQTLIQNAVLRDRSELCEIAVDRGRILDIAVPGTYASKDFVTTIDAESSLVTESFASPHIHLDKTLIGESIINESGTLWEAIEKTWEYKRNYTIQDIVTRASRIIRQQIEYGVTKIRTHVDVDSIGGLRPLEALLEVKQQFGDLIDLQIVAFPQEGILKDPGTQELLVEALEMGADVLGGMPHNERSDADSLAHITILLDLAERFQVAIDAHVDETDDPYSRTLENFAAEALKRQFPYAIAAGHTCALSAYNDYHAAKVIALVKEAKIDMIANPPTNMALQGRLDSYGGQRVGTTRVKDLLQAGINVTVGQDCIKDPYYPYGKGDMLEVANLTGHAAKMTLPGEIEALYDFISGNACATMGLSDYELKPGAKADLVILKGVKNVWEAIRLQPPGRTVLRAGKCISESSYSCVQNF